MKITAMIPVRVGSTRLKLKNLALLAGKPLVSYAIEAAQASGIFERVVINCDSDALKSLTDRHGAELYVRPGVLGSSETKSDEVVHDFLEHYACEAVAWVNTTSPFQTPDEIRGAVEHFKRENLDSLMTVREEPVHCVAGEKPVNFDPDVLFARTQDLVSVRRFVYSVMMWRTKTFRDAYQKKGHAFFSGKIGYYPVSRATSILIKTAEDLAYAETLMRGMQSGQPRPVVYDPLAEKITGGAVKS